MSWLRIDDGFSRHPKVTALTHKERWTWLDLLCYCARYQTGGWLPDNIREHVSGATTKYLSTCSGLGLIDVVEGELRIHDWDEYAPKDPTGAERQASWRRRRRNARVTESVTEPVTDETVTEPSLARDAGAGTRARSRPVLSKELPKAVTEARPPAGADGEGTAQVHELVNQSLKEAS